MNGLERFLRGAACVAMAVGSSAAGAAMAQVQDYDIQAQDLGGALRAAALVAGKSLIVSSELVEGRRSAGLKGRFTFEAAVARLLAGTGLTAVVVGDGLVIRSGEAAAASGELQPGSDEDIVVTGTRIRGSAVVSPVVVIAADAARDAGQASLTDVVRSIPQSFGGGQNRGIGFNVPAASGIDVGGGSSVNLRGLGSDATLTLLNGHRLAYSASRQSVDISAIPLAAVERIEIVPDGASALYGSDAVAGVANVILKRDFGGLETRARLGGSTDGGNFQQLYGATAGVAGNQGGWLAAYEFGDDSPIRAGQRSYARDRDPSLTFFPAIQRHNALIAGHRQLTPDLEVAIDALYNHRESDTRFPLTATLGAASRSTAESYALAPSLRYEQPSTGWRAAMIGTYGYDRVDFTTDLFSGGTLLASTPIAYINGTGSVEMNADGPLFELPGGPARVAIGGGYRSNGFENFRGEGGPSNFDVTQDSYYGFGELNLPLIAPGNASRLGHRLNLSAALRYEDYTGVGSVATPKLGLVYAPNRDFEVKGSWGRSFRAPTFFQKFQLQSAYLADPAIFGGTGLPPGATVLLVSGGNEELKPERATSWSASFVAHPVAVPGARLEIGYFDVDYRDRVVAPITFLSEALSDPAYRQQVITSPSAALQAETIAAAGEFLNIAGVPYDPANVAAIILNANVNAGRQRVHGVDLLASYAAEVAPGSSLNFSLNATYIDSEQQLSSDQAVQPLAGLVFNPPHWRGRATLGWTRGGLTLTGAADVIGGVEDRRSEPAAKVDGMTSFDLTARYRLPDGPSLLRGLDLVLSVQNIFNAKPDRIATTLPFDAPYDSTNYSPIGRFVSLAVAKRW